MPDFDHILQAYDGGMRRDFSRDALPRNSVWNMQDYIPERLASRLRKRGGYSYGSQAVSAITGSASYVYSGIWAPFTAGAAVLINDEDGKWHNVTASAATSLTSDSVLSRDPVFYDDAVYCPESTGVSAGKKITGIAANSITAWGGSPPAGKYAVVYKDVLWLASPSASSDRIHFSTAGQPEDTWDTTNKWLDVSFPITGLAAMQNAVFVFGLSRTARIRGSVPPPDTDFIVDDPIFDVGCTDNRSISLYRDKVYWANAEGIYFSDGSAMDDLTKICGMKQWWLSVMGGLDGVVSGTAYDQSSWVISTGIFGDMLFYSIDNGSGTNIDAGFIDLVRFTWHRMQNQDSNFMFRRPYPSELYVCQRASGARLATMSTLFNPSASVSADADGTAVTPVLETGFFMGPPTLKTFRRLGVFYDVRDPGSSNPTLTVSYITSPESTAYTAFGDTLAETTELTRYNIVINKPARGMAFKIAQSNASSDTRLYDLEIQAEEREGLR